MSRFPKPDWRQGGRDGALEPSMVVRECGATPHGEGDLRPPLAPSHSEAA